MTRNQLAGVVQGVSETRNVCGLKDANSTEFDPETLKANAANNNGFEQESAQERQEEKVPPLAPGNIRIIPLGGVEEIEADFGESCAAWASHGRDRFRPSQRIVHIGVA